MASPGHNTHTHTHAPLSQVFLLQPRYHDDVSQVACDLASNLGQVRSSCSSMVDSVMRGRPDVATRLGGEWH